MRPQIGVLINPELTIDEKIVQGLSRHAQISLRLRQFLDVNPHFHEAFAWSAAPARVVE